MQAISESIHTAGKKKRHLATCNRRRATDSFEQLQENPYFLLCEMLKAGRELLS